MFGKILKAYRERTGLSQARLAGWLEMSRNYLAQIEKGEARNISWKLGNRILKLQDAPNPSEWERAVEIPDDSDDVELLVRVRGHHACSKMEWLVDIEAGMEVVFWRKLTDKEVSDVN